MNDGRTVFSQLMDFLPLHQFRRCVERYSGHYKIQSFTCLDQFLCLAFAQLTYRESLRDIEACLRAQQPKLYHRGFRGRLSPNTLADANEQLGDLRRFRSVLDWHGSRSVPQGTFWRGVVGDPCRPWTRRTSIYGYVFLEELLPKTSL